jgi:hypothetical protein
MQVGEPSATSALPRSSILEQSVLLAVVAPCSQVALEIENRQGPKAGVSA